MKLDGYRALAVNSGSGVTLFSRRKKSLNTKLPYMVGPLADLPEGTGRGWRIGAVHESGRCNLGITPTERSDEPKGKTMKLVFVAIFCMCAFLGSSSGEPQKHAPSVTQCRSDAAVWNKEEDTGPKDKDVGYQLPFGELLKRQREMMGCVKSDAQHDQYRTIYHVYTTAMYARYQHFLERHQLTEKFLDEDSKGSR